MQRVWGGRMLETHFLRTLPDPTAPYGESWEIVDRPEAQSMVIDGPYSGKCLHELWMHHRDEIFGTDVPQSTRFPLLIKILDAKEDLSLQVHPPAQVAAQLGAEPKTEMWYIAHAEPGARLVAGLKAGVSREQFAHSLSLGKVAELIHEIPVVTGDHFLIHSGRLHAIGAGLLIYEIQQNSDSTYRVFDWNRLGLDGKPRDLHVDESMASIDFEDIEPTLSPAKEHQLAHCEHFTVEKHQLAEGQKMGAISADRFSILIIVSGNVQDEEDKTWSEGSIMLLTPGEQGPKARGEVTLLRIDCGSKKLLTKARD